MWGLCVPSWIPLFFQLILPLVLQSFPDKNHISSVNRNSCTSPISLALIDSLCVTVWLASTLRRLKSSGSSKRSCLFMILGEIPVLPDSYVRPYSGLRFTYFFILTKYTFLHSYFPLLFCVLTRSECWVLLDISVFGQLRFSYFLQIYQYDVLY